MKLTLDVDVPLLVGAASDAVNGAADVCAGVVATDRTNLELTVDGEHLRVVGSTPAHRWLRVTVHLNSLGLKRKYIFGNCEISQISAISLHVSVNRQATVNSFFCC